MPGLSELYDLFSRSTGVSTDTRTIGKDNLFFALKGPNFDGNKYAKEALKKGAMAAVVDDLELENQERMVLVADSLKTLQQLATHHRRTFDIPVLCITGSNGKTTTKELINVVLSMKYKVHCTSGNFNNLIGLPLTMLDMPRDADIAILEIGTSKKGEIARLSSIAQPTNGVITNIGHAHLEELIDLDGVAREKGALFKFLAEKKGTVFVNLDEEYLNHLASDVPNRVYYYESDMEDPARNKYGIGYTRLSPTIEYFFHVESERYVGQSPLFGIHNFKNISTAIAIGRYFQVPPERIIEGIAGYNPTNNRSQVIRVGSNTLILDAYNSNPSSASSVVELVSEWPDDLKKLVILGDMLELGEKSDGEHEKMVQKLSDKKFDEVHLVGECFMKVKQDQFPVYPNVDKLKKIIDLHERNGWLILLKGSRGIQLEKLVDELTIDN